MFKGMVPPGRFQAACVSGGPPGPNRVLQDQQKQNQAQEKKELLYHTYYHTPLPLNLANKQASKQQASNKQASTFPFRFGNCSASSLRALLYSSHPRA